MIVIYGKDEGTSKYFHFPFQHIPDDYIDNIIQNYDGHLTANVWYFPGTIDVANL